MHDDHDDFSSLVIGCDELMIHHPCACCHDLEVNGPTVQGSHYRYYWSTAFDGRRVSCCHVFSVTNLDMMNHEVCAVNDEVVDRE